MQNEVELFQIGTAITNRGCFYKLVHNASLYMRDTHIRIQVIISNRHLSAQSYHQNHWICTEFAKSQH